MLETRKFAAKKILNRHNTTLKGMIIVTRKIIRR